MPIQICKATPDQELRSPRGRRGTSSYCHPVNADIRISTGRDRREVGDMTQVVQAKCPGCQRVLRIPADWMQASMRCKHCGLVFQAKPKLAAPRTSPPDTLSPTT